MSFFFYDEPIHESDRSILNNSVCDDTKSDSSSDSDSEYYGHPFLSGYPYFYGYPPYFYQPPPQVAVPPSSATPSTTTTATPKPKAHPLSTPKVATTGRVPSRKSTGHGRQHPMDKDVYKLVDFRPNNDLFEDEKNYYIQLDLPGMTKEQIHMELSEDRILTISGKRENKFKSGTGEKKAGLKVSKMDCQYGKFSRSFNIHETADLDKIVAKMENGVLEVTIPKTEPQKTQRRTIQVK